MSSLKNTRVFRLDPKDPDRAVLSRCAAVIRSGGLAAFPTETVYGIAANPLNRGAIKRLYIVKNRPRGKPFTIHIADRSAIKKMGCCLIGDAKILAKRFWPGPLTIILKSRSGKKTGFRMPANRIALELIKLSRIPVVAPSANLSGHPAPVCAKDVLRDFDGRIDLVIDGGRTKVGIESTVVDMSAAPPKILREGAISARELRKALA